MDIKGTIDKIDKAIPDNVKEQAKKLATKENIDKAKNAAEDVLKKVRNGKDKK